MNVKVVFSNNSDNRDTISDDIGSIYEFLVGKSRCFSVLLRRSSMILTGLSLSVLSESSTHVGSIRKCTLKEALECIKGSLWLGGPVMSHNRGNTA